MAWFVYILLCDEKTFYVGCTDNVERRLKQHQNKESPYTKKFSHIELKYKEQHPAQWQAEKRESQIKKWSIAKKKALIDGDIELLKRLSNAHGSC